MPQTIYLAVFTNGTRPRNYDFNMTQRKHLIIRLAQVADNLITDTPGNGLPSQDTTARDRLESAATVVRPPGWSPNPLDPANWMQDYVQRLILDGFVDSSTAQIVQSSPRVI
ncbi:hypothetical protein BDV19DRAFT_380724 [Aspergillus venezuelensis]